MRSLCLNVEALDAAGNAIDLRDEDDEDYNVREDLGITLDARPNAAATIDAI
jgi:DNA-directed RNA polymerase subunit beta